MQKLSKCVVLDSLSKRQEEQLVKSNITDSESNTASKEWYSTFNVSASSSMGGEGLPQI